MIKRLYYRIKARVDPEAPMSQAEQAYHAKRLGIDPKDLKAWDKTVARRFRTQYKNVQ